MADKKSPSYYTNRKKDGLCIRCGKPIDRNGVYCENCLEITNAIARESREFLKQHGICPYCRKNSILGDETMCPECSAKWYIWHMKSNRKPRTEEQKKNARERKKALRGKRIKMGICTICGKRKVAPMRKSCRICLDKIAERKRIKCINTECD